MSTSYSPIFRKASRADPHAAAPKDFDPAECPIIACHWFGLGHISTHRFEEADDSNLLEREVA